jgi:hypothetical protein
VVPYLSFLTKQIVLEKVCTHFLHMIWTKFARICNTDIYNKKLLNSGLNYLGKNRRHHNPHFKKTRTHLNPYQQDVDI